MKAPIILLLTTAFAAAQSVDWGDAPDASLTARYPTLTIHNGARHTASGPMLGTLRDAESNGQPTTGAAGDDATAGGIDDEDGVEIPDLIRGDTIRLRVTVTGGSGFLNAWIDWNHDDDWDDAGERVFTNLSVAAGVVSPPVSVPATALEGKSFARFRLTQASVTNPVPTGSLPTGEVEDYMVSIITAADVRLALSATSSALALGQDSVLTVTLTNSGPATATALTAGFALPSALTQQGAATLSAGTWNGSVWSAGSLASGASATLSVTARAQSSGTPSVYAEVLTSVPGDSDSAAGNHSGRGLAGDPVHEDDDASLTLALGTAAPPQNVSGKVWYDADEDGVADAGEPGLAATVKLRSAGPNQILDDSDDTFATTASAADGTWVFTSRPAGLYRVTLDATPAGFTSSGSAPAPFTVAASPVTGKNLGLRGTGTFSVSVVMLDASDEAPVANIPVTLLWAGPDGDATTTADNRTFGPVLTKPEGTAVFQHVPPGLGVVTLNSSALPAGVRAVDDPDGTDTPHAAQVPLEFNSVSFSYTQLTELRGQLFADRNNDGLGNLDEEGPSPPLKLELIRSADSSVVRTLENVSGFYQITGFPPDTYRLRVTGLPAGHFFSPLAADTADRSGNDIASNGLSAPFVIGTAGLATVDAGVATTAIVVHVLMDDNGDGIAAAKANAGVGLRGTQVQVFHANGTAASTAQPAQGQVRFAGLAGGSYFVRFTVPAGLGYSPPGVGDEASDSDAIPGANPLIAETAVISLATGQESSGLTDALLTGHGIAGFVWDDRNANSRIDDFPPAPASENDFLRQSGLTVRVIDAVTLDDAAPPQVTGADGLFGFYGMPPGNYFIKVSGLTAGQQFSPATGNQDVNAAGVSPVITIETGILQRNFSAGVFDPANLRLAIAAIEAPAGGTLKIHTIIEPGTTPFMQQSADLQTWTKAAGSFSRPDNSNEPARIFTATLTPGAPRFFYRLVLE